MDLAKFAQMPKENSGTFLKFTPSDNVKIVRFCYNAATDVQCRQKLFDPTTRKVIWDTPDGQWKSMLKVAVYSSKADFQFATWERSSQFCQDNLMPLWDAAGGRVCDTVYKVTCTKAGTLDATYSYFPLKDSETYAMPNMSAEEEQAEAPAVAQPAPVAQPTPVAPSPAPAPVAPQPVAQPAVAQPTAPATPKKKNFWEA